MPESGPARHRQRSRPNTQANYKPGVVARLSVRRSLKTGPSFRSERKKRSCCSAKDQQQLWWLIKESYAWQRPSLERIRLRLLALACGGSISPDGFSNAGALNRGARADGRG